MRFTPTPVEDAWIVDLEPHGDDRGWFARAYCRDEFAEAGIDFEVVQVNLAETTLSGTVRGLHFQRPPSGEQKLVRCVAGSIFDVIVDVRSGSSTFGAWFGAELSAADARALLVPSGCAHGYQALEDQSRALYFADAPYAPDAEDGLHHADPSVGIRWPLPAEHVSSKDAQLPILAKLQPVD
jgi:dTDP-4-dehydrorhamnose 3,5-epimerase